MSYFQTSSSLLNFKTIRQLFSFGTVGTLAAVVHLSIVILLVEISIAKPLIANIIAFFCSFSISYLGHRHWTFAKHTHSHSTPSLLRFFILASLSFLINEGLFYYFLKILPYPYALILVLSIVAIFTFIFSKLWAFR